MHDVPWELYVHMRDAMDSSRPSLRMTYCEGELELMAPSAEHERQKKLIGHLLEAWCVDRGIDLFPLGSTTYRHEQAARGLEADESYCVGRSRDEPDFAIEVSISPFRVDKLDVYRGLGVPEVWLFRSGSFTLYRLVDTEYVVVESSAFLPDLDLRLLAAHVDTSLSLTAAVRNFRRALGSG